MSIGPDIAEVFDELGTAITIYKADGREFQEKIDMEYSVQASSPFLTQFIIGASFVYNTNAAPGDVVTDDEGVHYLIAAMNSPKFENQIVVYECVLYRCNVVGALKKMAHVRPEGSVSYTPTWNILQEDVPALLTGLPDDKLLSGKDYGEFPSFEMNLHLSGNVEIEVKHRFELTNGDKLEVIGIEPRRLNNVSICKVRADERA